MMASHHHSCPVVVAMPLRCVKHPGPFPPPTTASGRSPLCACKTRHYPPCPHTGDQKSRGAFHSLCGAAHLLSSLLSLCHA